MRHLLAVGILLLAASHCCIAQNPPPEGQDSPEETEDPASTTSQTDLKTESEKDPVIPTSPSDLKSGKKKDIGLIGIKDNGYVAFYLRGKYLGQEHGTVKMEILNHFQIKGKPVAKMDFPRQNVIIDRAPLRGLMKKGKEIMAPLGVDGNNQSLYVPAMIAREEKNGNYLLRPVCNMKAPPAGVYYSFIHPYVGRKNMKASSELNAHVPAFHGRLYTPNKSKWCPKGSDTESPWLQILACYCHVCKIRNHIRDDNFFVTVCNMKAPPAGVYYSFIHPYVGRKNMKASSELNAHVPAFHGRLYTPNKSKWCPKGSDTESPWLQVDLNGRFYICSVSVTGMQSFHTPFEPKRGDSEPAYIINFKISVSNDEEQWRFIEENGKEKHSLLHSFYYVSRRSRSDESSFFSTTGSTHERTGYVCNLQNDCDNIPDAECSHEGNAPGSYTCRCMAGYRGPKTTFSPHHARNVSCTDIDECADKQSRCPNNAVCKNTAGSYDCVCKKGFEMSDGECKDIDECSLKPAKCSSNSICSNTQGSYKCECGEGFKMQGNVCIVSQMPLVSNVKVETATNGDVIPSPAEHSSIVYIVLSHVFVAIAAASMTTAGFLYYLLKKK
ncbi:predicted protein [Nematostella vectensis]|uniref:Uncharacterized protein n=1 Tax=Nematostella vectensis TaxID=45351 RepID=A7SCV1_NEMVE|nr:predicted protein [Nematostella vectensis]|eukprot:XP_001630562.1 predicted protein [Nematostella vectensis]